MWQVLLAAAAAAGSGILAKKLINPTDTEKPINQNDLDSPRNNDKSKENGRQEQEKLETFSDDGEIFRFSSPDSGSKELQRKITRSGISKNGGLKRGNRKWAVDGGGDGAAVDQRSGNGSGKKISVCLKKRRTGKHVAGKCESCASKDNSFGWGVGVGIMYMMSAGNAEISKLNCAMDETVKTVQELKAEVSRRKISLSENASISENESKMNEKYLERNYNGPSFTKLDANSKCDLTTFGSIVKDEQQPEVLEMDRLEAEFESELQKLHFCATEGSTSEGRTDIFEAKGRESEDLFEHSSSFQYNGVLPGELDGKLRNLLIKQQENQIVELEVELHDAHSKLHEKEAELRALKDCVKRLTEFSLANASDEETENHEEDVKTIDAIEEKARFESTESTVGMKRTLGYEYDSYICSKN